MCSVVQCLLVVIGVLPFEQKGIPQPLFSVFSFMQGSFE